jgi:hypothetical protein
MTSPSCPTAEQMAELQKKATKGPWWRTDPPWGRSDMVHAGPSDDPHTARAFICQDVPFAEQDRGETEDRTAENMEFIAAARSFDFTTATANERRVRELEGHLSDAYRLLAKHEEEIERLKVARRAAVDEIIDGWREQDALASQAGQVEQNPEAAYDHMRQWLTSVLQSHFQESGK